MLTLLPAVDVADGKAVRLLQGEVGSETDYGSPVDAARDWVRAGAEWIHLVDLDAAFGREDQQLAARAGHEVGDDLGGQRRQPRQPIGPRHGDHRQVRAAHQGATALEGPLLSRRIAEVRGRTEGGHGLVDELGIGRGLRQGSHPGNRRCPR